MATARSINVHLRLKPREVKMWRASADAADETLSEYIRRCVNTDSERRLNGQSRRSRR